MEDTEDGGREEDPRVTGAYVRRVPGRSGSVTLVGVVHDHPASVHRVRRTVRRRSPDVLALELPPLAIPLFEQYAADTRAPPAFGGEMSAAIQAATTDRIVGIDRPTAGFYRRLVRVLLRERPSPSTVRGALSNAASATGHAVLCRIAATVTARTGLRTEVDAPAEHGVGRSAPPARQAADERRQIRRSRAFLDTFDRAQPLLAAQLVDEAREARMAERLTRHRSDGDVLGVVGIDHLDALVERVSD